MAEDKRPPLPSMASQSSLAESEHNPFSDRSAHLTFQEPPPSAYASTTTLNQEFGGRNAEYIDDDDEIEKVPLTSAGGLYPPG